MISFRDFSADFCTNEVADVSTECSCRQEGESEEVPGNKCCYLQPFTTEDTCHWRSKVGEDCSSLPAFSSQQSSNQGLPVLHLS